MKNTEAVAGLLSFIEKSPTCFHVIENIKKELSDYSVLDEKKDWKLEAGGKYLVERNGSSMISFRVPKEGFTGFHIAAAHSDRPCFKLKPSASMKVEKAYVKLNTEKYGGMILSTWLDRPLSVAGRMFIRVNGKVQEMLIAINDDLVLIPSVAIHMNRNANDGYAWNPQVDMLPLFSGNEGDDLMDILSDCMGVNKADVLGTDLYLFNRMKGSVFGANEEFIASPALDDLECVYGLLEGFKMSDNTDHLGKMPLFCVFDNEEVGSLTRQGADSTFLYDTLIRIQEALGLSDGQLRRLLADSFMLSADNAHAVHPNHPELADPTNRPYLNRGIVLKFSSNQKYTTDGKSEAYVRELCQEAGVPIQTYVNRSDILGGSTLGNLSARHVSISAADIGLPQLAMHSSYETAGAKDIGYLIQLMDTYYRK